MPPENTAAWLPAKSVKPFVIGPAPYTPPKSGQLVIRNAAVAINPLDWIKQVFGNTLLGHIKYPFILGGDVAGTVVEVGPGSEPRFKVGDRVLANAMAAAPESNDPAEGGFQKYTVARQQFVSVIPAWMPFEEACVVPLTLCTAAYGLFHRDFLALNPPSVPPPEVEGKKTVVIITGGASSVGCNAIQLATSAGYDVFTTCSPRNTAYAQGLGASRVFDYHTKTLAGDMLAELKDRKVAGAMAIGDGAVETCTEVLRRCPGTQKKFIALAGSLPPGDQVSSAAGRAMYMGSMAWWFGKSAVRSSWTGVQVKFIDSKELMQEDSIVGRLVYRDFLPKALAAKQFVPAPKPLVVGHGLEKIQEAMEVQQKGVSAQKVVVTL